MRPQRSRRQSPLVAAAVVVLLVLGLALLAREYYAQPFRVPSASMRPLLQEGDVILVDRTHRGQAHRGDVVVIDGSGYFGPTDSGSHYWVKRVIGVGGDDIRVRDGELTVNGLTVTEPYLPAGTHASDIDFHVQVPEGTVFLMGDNRANSTDSRHHLGAPGGGMVPVERVLGPVDRIVWPWGRAGKLPAQRWGSGDGDVADLPGDAQ